MKKVLLLASIALLLSCNNEKTEKNDSAEIQTTVENPVYDTQNYAVVWKWTTTDKELVTDNTESISQELTDLWKNGTVENAYYDADNKVDKLDNFPNITFFLKAKSIDDAKDKLNNLTIVKKGIAEHTIYPVGTLWLGRKTEKINNYGNAQTYVAVWNTTKLNNSEENEFPQEIIQAQNNAILELWDNGIVENVYFDIEGTSTENLKTDFVFFINAKTENDAETICNNLPFSKNQLAAYKLLPVGMHWLGQGK